MNRVEVRARDLSPLCHGVAVSFKQKTILDRYWHLFGQYASYEKAHLSVIRRRKNHGVAISGRQPPQPRTRYELWDGMNLVRSYRKFPREYLKDLDQLVTRYQQGEEPPF